MAFSKEDSISESLNFLQRGGPVLISTPYPNWPIHWEASLEFAQRFIDSGQEVVILRCGGEIGSCDSNLSNRKSVCRACIRRQSRGVSLLDSPVKMSWIDEPSPDQVKLVLDSTNSFTSLSDWTNWQIGGFDIGQAVHSSLASDWAFRDHEPDINDPIVRHQFQRLAVASLTTFETARRVITSSKIKTAVIFNGRLSITRAIVSACKEAQIPFATHERGPTLSRFGIWINSLPHDVDATKKQVIDLYRSIGPAAARDYSEEVYLDRRFGKVDNWHSFTKSQRLGSDAGMTESNAFRIVIFTSSQTEFVALNEGWNRQIFTSQEVALCELLKLIPKVRPHSKVWIRMHPNQAGNNREIGFVSAFASDRVHVVLPQSDVDSYALMTKANLVVSFGSTTGIEAAYWGSASLLLGPSPYGGLGSTYEPKDLKEIESILMNDPKPLPTFGAEMYGAYLRISGLEFQYASEYSLGNAEFKGVNLGGSRNKYIRRSINFIRGFHL